MLTDTPDQATDRVQLADAFQGVGASIPATATHHTDGVQTNAQVLYVYGFWQTSL